MKVKTVDLFLSLLINTSLLVQYSVIGVPHSPALIYLQFKEVQALTSFLSCGFLGRDDRLQFLDCGTLIAGKWDGLQMLRLLCNYM